MYNEIFTSPETFKKAQQLVECMVLNEPFENLDECIEATYKMLFEKIDGIYEVKASLFIKAELKDKITKITDERYLLKVRN